MMKINRNNYEVYFVDFFEGNLNSEEKEELLQFLSDNPDLKNEFEEFEKYTDINTEEECDFKDELKKQISDLGPVNSDTIDEYSIAYLENDLNEAGKKMLLKAISSNADFERTFKLYQLTKQEPDLSVVYPNIRQLKHYTINRRIVLRAVGYASAAAAIVVGVFVINPFEKEIPSDIKITEIAQPDDQVNTAIDSIITKEKPIEVIQNNMEDIPENGQPVIAENKLKTDQDVIIINSTKRELIQMNLLKPKNNNPIINEANSDIVIAINNDIDNNIHISVQPATNIPQEENTLATNSRKSYLLNIASIGLKGFNKLNETNFALEPNYSSNGKLESVTLITEKRRITAPVI